MEFVKIRMQRIRIDFGAEYINVVLDIYYMTIQTRFARILLTHGVIIAYSRGEYWHHLIIHPVSKLLQLGINRTLSQNGLRYTSR